MTALDATAPPDIDRLVSEFRATVLPSARDFLKKKISANELRRVWRPYYYDVFHPYDLSVERAWRSVAGSEGRLESGPPQADPAHELPLLHFPVSIAHNNFDRLIEVLAVELGDGTVEATGIPERIVDFAHVVDALYELMTSLAERS
ncbi:MULTISPECIES: hypothetical protein [Actinomadura]|uniref:Uncharacterized protein n=1 Tax=Actinomadura litoris TaxID=2678616 RepID=A0A7K1LE55_9ACTN|nr:MULTISPECIES: hypothetical protein [Actinomadura]MBT2212741.1 hypothetical protein [Actinomadura sp. NEAU-AAG7]MUN42699.1 hypothetical protein [Actinomadura litoris]